MSVVRLAVSVRAAAVSLGWYVAVGVDGMSAVVVARDVADVLAGLSTGSECQKSQGDGRKSDD